MCTDAVGSAGGGAAAALVGDFFLLPFSRVPKHRPTVNRAFRLCPLFCARLHPAPAGSTGYYTLCLPIYHLA